MLSVGVVPGGGSNACVAGPSQRTTRPIVTGTSVLAVKYDGGVMMAADTLASYGTLARYKDMRRMIQVGGETLVGAGGEMSDFQTLTELLGDLTQDDFNEDDGFRRTPAEIFSYLRAVMYNRRNKFDPLWNNLLVAGMRDGKAFLGNVDLIGTAFEENYTATGFGAHLAVPLMRERWTEGMDEGEARALLEDCMRVLFYRDCRASNRIQLSKSDANGVLISEPYLLDFQGGTTPGWDCASFRQTKGGQDTGGSW